MTRSIEDLKKYGKIQTLDEHLITTRYAFADETEILKEIGMKEDDCNFQYIQWLYKNMLILVEIYSTLHGDPRVTIRSGYHPSYDYDFLINTNHHPILQSTVSNMLKVLIFWLETHSKVISLEKNTIKILTTEDIGAASPEKVYWRECLDV